MDNLISYEDFSKLNIKIGTIKEAERIEGSEKLLKLLIDLGEEELRQVVSGIAQFYTPEQLIGKQIPVLANLQPRKLMGIESNGMILAAGDNENIILLHPNRETANGTDIS